jgi:hypothetical protein
MRFCGASLQAGTLKSSGCPPEGGRYRIEKRVLTQTLQGLKPLLFTSLNVAAEAATEKLAPCNSEGRCLPEGCFVEAGKKSRSLASLGMTSSTFSAAFEAATHMIIYVIAWHS